MTLLAARALTWSTVLRPNEHALSDAECDQVADWLSYHRWRLFARDNLWIDPLDAGYWALISAARMQATRQAQRLLEPRGWSLATGFVRLRTWVICWHVSHGDLVLPLDEALAREGLSLPLSVPKRLQLIVGGRA